MLDINSRPLLYSIPIIEETPKKPKNKLIKKKQFLFSKIFNITQQSRTVQNYVDKNCGKSFPLLSISKDKNKSFK